MFSSGQTLPDALATLPCTGRSVARAGLGKHTNWLAFLLIFTREQTQKYKLVSLLDRMVTMVSFSLSLSPIHTHKDTHKPLFWEAMHAGKFQ